MQVRQGKLVFEVCLGESCGRVGASVAAVGWHCLLGSFVCSAHVQLTSGDRAVQQIYLLSSRAIDSMLKKLLRVVHRRMVPLLQSALSKV